MPLVTSGQISLNDMHVEVGGTSATECSLDDADIRGLIGKSSGAQSQFNEFYGASSVQYIVFAPVSGTYTTFDSGDYRYYQFSGAQNNAPSITNLGTTGNDREKLYFKMWGAGGGGGGGGTYAGATGGAGGHARGYYVPTATGKLRMQIGSGGSGGQNMSSTGLPTVAGGAGGQPSGISTDNLLGGTGGSGYGGTSAGSVGGGGGGGGATRFRTEWSSNGPASPTFEVWIGGGGGGGASDQNATGSPTAGGSGGGVDFGNPNYSPGLTASSINNSGGGGGATSIAGGAGGTGYNTSGAQGEAGVAYHGGDGGSGPSAFFGGSGGGGAGQYGGGGGGTGSASQGAGGGGGSGNHSGSVSLIASNRQALGNRVPTNTGQLGYVSPAGYGGTAGPITGATTSAVTYAGGAGSGCIVLYHKFQN